MKIKNTIIAFVTILSGIYNIKAEVYVEKEMQFLRNLEDKDYRPSLSDVCFLQSMADQKKTQPSFCYPAPKTPLGILARVALTPNACKTALIYIGSASISDLPEQISEAEKIITDQQQENFRTLNALRNLGKQNIVVQDLLTNKRLLQDFSQILSTCKSHLQSGGPEH